MEQCKKYIAALDIGTTNIKCNIYSDSMVLVGKASCPITLIYPTAGYEEINPDVLWNAIIITVREAIKDAGLSADQITCMGISSQRGTFTVWDKETGVPLCNFITWKDRRAAHSVQKWNNHFIIRVTLRLKWILSHLPCTPELKLRYGTIDCWLLHKLTNGKVFVSDLSNASPTGMLDPFNLNWFNFLCIFGIPMETLPTLCQSTGHHFGNVEPEIWGAPIPIMCSMADQMASAYGSFCFNIGDTKITLGTGGFIDINTGSILHNLNNGWYPLVGWYVNNEITYIAESGCHEVGSIINWVKSLGFCVELSDLSNIAYSVNDCGDVYFLPIVNGLQELFDICNSSTYGFIGITETTTRNHMVRSILESIIFHMYQLYSVNDVQDTVSPACISIDGGVSQNDFICQSLADMIGITITRSNCIDVSARGVAFLAGLTTGIWKDKEELRKFQRIEKVFIPDTDNGERLLKYFNKWIYVSNQFLK